MLSFTDTHNTHRIVRATKQAELPNEFASENRADYFFRRAPRIAFRIARGVSRQTSVISDVDHPIRRKPRNTSARFRADDGWRCFCALTMNSIGAPYLMHSDMQSTHIAFSRSSRRSRSFAAGVRNAFQPCSGCATSMLARMRLRDSIISERRISAAIAGYDAVAANGTVSGSGMDVGANVTRCACARLCSRRKWP